MEKSDFGQTPNYAGYERKRVQQVIPGKRRSFFDLMSMTSPNGKTKPSSEAQSPIEPDSPSTSCFAWTWSRLWRSSKPLTSDTDSEVGFAQAPRVSLEEREKEQRLRSKHKEKDYSSVPPNRQPSMRRVSSMKSSTSLRSIFGLPERWADSKTASVRHGARSSTPSTSKPLTNSHGSSGTSGTAGTASTFSSLGRVGGYEFSADGWRYEEPGRSLDLRRTEEGKRRRERAVGRRSYDQEMVLPRRHASEGGNARRPRERRAEKEAERERERTDALLSRRHSERRGRRHADDHSYEQLKEAVKKRGSLTPRQRTFSDPGRGKTARSARRQSAPERNDGTRDRAITTDRTEGETMNAISNGKETLSKATGKNVHRGIARKEVPRELQPTTGPNSNSLTPSKSEFPPSSFNDASLSKHRRSSSTGRRDIATVKFERRNIATVKYLLGDNDGDADAQKLTQSRQAVI